jgi:hypothetical protein
MDAENLLFDTFLRDGKFIAFVTRTDVNEARGELRIVRQTFKMSTDLLLKTLFTVHVLRPMIIGNSKSSIYLRIDFTILIQLSVQGLS